jgi:hypothetical protein
VMTNHALPHQPIHRERVRMTLHSSRRPRSVSSRRIDERHANPRRLWVKRGKPEYLSSGMVERLDAASHLEDMTHPFEFENRTTRLELDLLPHSMASVAVAFQTT